MNNEPIAIIGIGCRFPGADGPKAFWKLLLSGHDSINTIPSDRWNAKEYHHSDSAFPDKMGTIQGGFLDRIGHFDAPFFGISPQEAAHMDPQHRLLLETAWEALEDAGYVPSHLAGTKTGVFVGISGSDYGFKVWDQVIDTPYGNIGTNRAMASNRLSYFFDFTGPSVSIDTACSSSLNAVHLACQSLRAKESTLTLVGGVNLILSPQIMAGLDKTGVLSPTGTCKAFDAKADGFVRGEGVGLLVLKPLREAQKHGDLIYAVIRGSAMNQDGRSSGLTAPNPIAQERLLQEAYQQAGVVPGHVQYIEAQGIGSLLGDSIELKALGKILAQGRSADSICRVGSVKTNIGHLEAAAGISGLIKVALALHHRVIVPNLHFSEPNPYIPFTRLPLKVAQSVEPWPNTDGPALAGVSSFGFGGSNAHVVLEEAPRIKKQTSIHAPSFQLFTLRAKTKRALTDLALRYQGYALNLSEDSFRDFCSTANAYRSDFSHRLAIVTQSLPQLVEQLGQFIQGNDGFKGFQGEVKSPDPPKVAFLFSGENSYYQDLGRALYETNQVFRDILHHCEDILRPYIETPLLSLLYDKSREQRLFTNIQHTQVALFSVEFALAQVWKSWGIEPSIVIGHGLGHYVAACISGVFTLEDGLMLIATREQLLQHIPEPGAMLMVYADERETEAFRLQHKEELSLAAVNTHANHIIAGREKSIQDLKNHLIARGIKSRCLPNSHGLPSPLIDPVLEEFNTVCHTVKLSPPTLPFISTVTGQLANREVCDPNYWHRHTRDTIWFSDGMETLLHEKVGACIEIGGQPSLIEFGQQCSNYEGDILWTPSIDPVYSDWERMFLSLGELYVRGVPVNWENLAQAPPDHRLRLPTYPFQRERYWVAIPEDNTLHKSSPSSNDTPISEERIQDHQCPLQRILLELSLEERRNRIMQHIVEQAEKILANPDQGLTQDTSLVAQGLESLNAIELRNRIQTDFGINLALPWILQGVSLHEIAQHVFDLFQDAWAEESSKRKVFLSKDVPTQLDTPH